MKPLSNDGLEPPLEFELTLAGLEAYIRGHEVSTVKDLLSALPPHVGESFALMERSRSRHLASLEYPRLIMYGLDARFIVSASSHPEDPLLHAVEVAALDKEGRWQFRVVDFDVSPPAISQDNAACVACHGDPARPIWGSYPNWEGAFGGDEDRMTAAQADVVARLKDTQPSSDRFHGLLFPSDHSIRNNRTLYHAARSYGYANTAFNFELVVAVADGLVTRMKAQPGWSELRYDIIEAEWCGGSVEDKIETLGRLGVNGRNDFQLAYLAPEARGTGYDTFAWNQGSTGLEDVVAFRTLDDIVRTDTDVARIVEPIEETRSTWIEHWFELRGEARRAWLRDGFELYDYDLRPQELVPRISGPLCAHLRSR